jgi:hypothetical protein
VIGFVADQGTLTAPSPSWLPEFLAVGMGNSLRSHFRRIPWIHAGEVPNDHSPRHDDRLIPAFGNMAQLSAEVLSLSDLSAPERDALGDELFALHRKIFSGLSRRQFVDHVFHDHAAATKIKIFRNVEGTAVGYCAVHRYQRRRHGKRCTMFRAEAGLLKQYRGHQETASFVFMQGLSYKLRNPTRRVFYLGMLVHPSSYCLLAERFPTIYPSRRRKTPQHIRKAMCELADSFEVPQAEGDPLLREIGWITRETAAEADAWRSSRHPDVRFFLAMNPRYERGNGLVTLVPFTIGNLLGAAANHVMLTASRRRWRTG